MIQAYLISIVLPPDLSDWFRGRYMIPARQLGVSLRNLLEVLRKKNIFSFFCSAGRAGIWSCLESPHGERLLKNEAKTGKPSGEMGGQRLNHEGSGPWIKPHLKTHSRYFSYYADQ